MTRFVGRIARVAVVALGVNLFIAASAQATPIVVATVAPVGSAFRYMYSITFNELPADRIALLTVNVLANDASLTNLVAPAGFQLIYSSAAGRGFLDFLPAVGNDFPLTGTLSGFAFDSVRTPGATTFDGFTINFAPVSGATTGPVGPATAVPEPATWMLLGIGLAALGGRRLLGTWSRTHG